MAWWRFVSGARTAQKDESRTNSAERDGIRLGLGDGEKKTGWRVALTQPETPHHMGLGNVPGEKQVDGDEGYRCSYHACLSRQSVGSIDLSRMYMW